MKTAGSFVIAALTAGVFSVAHADDAKKPKAEESAARYTQEIVDSMDADRNHEVSKKEFLDFMSREFDRLDVNHDGKLQQTEIVDKPIGQQKSSVSHR